MTTALIVVAVVAAALLGVLRLSRVERARQTRAARQFARRNGLSFTVRDDSLPDRWRGCKGVFSAISVDREARNVIRGEWRRRSVVVFDYTYWTYGDLSEVLTGEHEPSQSADMPSELAASVAGFEFAHFTVIAMDAGAVFPALNVVPETIQSKLPFSNIDLESEEFNRAFWVFGPDREFASNLLTPQMMELLLCEPHIGWRMCGSDLMIVRPGHVPENDILLGLDLLARSIDLIPEHLKVDAGRSTPSPPRLGPV